MSKSSDIPKNFQAIDQIIQNLTRKMGDSTMTCVDILLAIILPPLGVFLKFGCKVEFWICVLLTFFGWLPGIVYAVWVLTK